MRYFHSKNYLCEYANYSGPFLNYVIFERYTDNAEINREIYLSFSTKQCCPIAFSSLSDNVLGVKSCQVIGWIRSEIYST